MKTYRFGPAILALMAVAILMAGFGPTAALAQCGGGSGSMGSMHDQNMGSSGHMGSGQMGMHGQAPVQPDPNAVAPGYVAPAPPVSGYTVPQQDTSGYGQTMGQGGAGTGQSGHMGH